jgi:hypothetical protein
VTKNDYLIALSTVPLYYVGGFVMLTRPRYPLGEHEVTESLKEFHKRIKGEHTGTSPRMSSMAANSQLLC